MRLLGFLADLAEALKGFMILRTPELVQYLGLAWPHTRLKEYPRYPPDIPTCEAGPRIVRPALPAAQDSRLGVLHSAA